MNPLGWADEAFCVRLTVTLGHFLWQGAVLGAVSAGAGVLLRRAAASRRYAVDLAVLAAMAACPPVTFVWVGPSRVATADSPSARVASPVVAGGRNDSPPAGLGFGSAETDVSAPVPPFDDEVAGRSSGSLSGLARPAVFAYLVGVSLLLCRGAVGQCAAIRLRRSARPVTDPRLLALAERLGERLSLACLPPLLETARAAVPAVVGVVRPAVLLPVAFASGLDARHVEAVLLHELAHVRRYDPLVNLLQRLIESLLFFHPAVWLVSRRLTEERERCCDDLVVACGVGPSVYAASLVEVAARGVERASLSPAVLYAGRRGSALGRRVGRLLGEPEPRAACLCWEGLTMTLLLTAAVTFGMVGYAPPGVSAEEDSRRSSAEDETRSAETDSERGGEDGWSPVRERTLDWGKPHLNLETGEQFPPSLMADESVSELVERTGAAVEFTHLDDRPVLAFHGVYAVKADRTDWETKSAAELRQAYADGGFAIVSFERESVHPIVAAELPLTILMENGLLQVAELVGGRRPQVRVKYKLLPQVGTKGGGPAEAADLSDEERGLVGRWIGGPLRPQLLILRADRTFAQLVYELGSLPSVARTFRGTWKVEDGELVRSFGRLPGGEDTLSCDRLRIVDAADDGYLMLSVVHDDGAVGSTGAYLRLREEERLPGLDAVIDEKTAWKASQLVGTWSRSSGLAVWYETHFADGSYLFTSNHAEIRFGRWKVVEGDLLLRWRAAPAGEGGKQQAGEENRVILSIDPERVAFARPDDPDGGLVPGGVAVRSYARVRTRPTD